VQVLYLYVERVNVHCVFMISVTMRCVADFIASVIWRCRLWIEERVEGKGCA